MENKNILLKKAAKLSEELARIYNELSHVSFNDIIDAEELDEESQRAYELSEKLFAQYGKNIARGK